MAIMYNAGLSPYSMQSINCINFIMCTVLYPIMLTSERVMNYYKFAEIEHVCTLQESDFLLDKMCSMYWCRLN